MFPNLKLTSWIFTCLLILSHVGISQKKSYTRELVFSEIKNAKHDTERVKLYIDQARVLAGNNPDSVLFWMYRGKSIAEANMFLLANKEDSVSKFIHRRFHRFKFMCYYKAAMFHDGNGNLTRALLTADSALSISKNLGDKKLMARAYNGVAIIKTYQGSVKEALLNYNDARKIYLELNDQSGLVAILINQAVIFSNMGETENCIKYYKDAIRISRKAGMKDNEGGALANLSGVLVEKRDYKEALPCLERGMQLAKELSDPELESRLYYTWGVMNYDKEDFDKAYIFFNKAKEIQERERNYMSLSLTLSSMSNVLSQKKDFTKAIQFSEQAHRMNLEIGAPRNIETSANSLYKLYKNVGNTTIALAFLELRNKMRDSVLNESNRKESIRQHLQSEFDKRTAADSVSRVKERELKNAELATRNAELKAKKKEQYALFVGIFVVFVFGLLMYNRFKVSQKQKKVIEEQKKEVEDQKEEMEKQKQLLEDKQKEVMDSIKYARKIQLAQIPTDKQVQKTLARLRKI